MPTVLRIHGYRFFFYSNEHEIKHIHIEKGESTAKFTIESVELVRSRGFNSKDINQIRKLIIKNQKHLIKNWDEYFNN